MTDKHELPKGLIHIILHQDPTVIPEVQIEGEWTFRQIASLPQFIVKAFKMRIRDEIKTKKELVITESPIADAIAIMENEPQQ